MPTHTQALDAVEQPQGLQNLACTTVVQLPMGGLIYLLQTTKHEMLVNAGSSMSFSLIAVWTEWPKGMVIRLVSVGTYVPLV